MTKWSLQRHSDEDGFETKGSSPYFSGLSMRLCQREHVGSRREKRDDTEFLG
jgi:hypothetical protein